MNRPVSFFANQKGNAAIIFGLSAAVLFGFGAMAVDVGSFFYEKRKLQTANDLAALAAASDIPRAQAAAQASASQNGFSASSIQTIQPGTYTPDPNKPPEARFVPGPATTANAVRVDMRTTAPLVLGKVLTSSFQPSTATQPSSGTPTKPQDTKPVTKPIQASISDEVPIGSSAIAYQDAQASFAIGSRLLKLDGGLLNSLLGGLLGGSVSLKLGIGERPVGTSLVRVGRLGTSVHTAQTRLLLTVDLIGSGAASMVRLPLYLELAAATARLTSIQCSPGDVSTSRVPLGVTPALVDAWIGQVSMTEFNNFITAPRPPAATLLNVAGLAKVSGRAHVTMTNFSETSVSFNYAEIQRGDKKTTSTHDFVATLLGRLVGDLKLEVEALDLGIGLPGLDGLVGGIIAGAATPLDQILNGLLGTLGIGLGQADSWVTGVRCGGAVLVR